MLKEYGVVLQQFRGDPSYRRNLAGIALVRAYLMEVTAPPQEAIEAYEEAGGYYADLVRANAQDGEARVCLARCVGAQGLLLLTMRRDDRAREKYDGYPPRLEAERDLVAAYVKARREGWTP